MTRLPPAPALPRPPARTAFPVVAVIAPIVGALVIGAIVRSPFVLVFALLSPLIAIATMLDGRRQARAHRRAEAQRFDRECRAFEAAIAAAHRDEAEAGRARSTETGLGSGRSDAVRVGTAPGRSTVVGDITAPLGEGEAERRVEALLARAAINPRLPALIPRGAVTVLGDGLAADAVERRLRSERGVDVRRDAANGVDSREHRSARVNGVALDRTVLVVRSATRMELHGGGRVLTVRPEFDAAVLGHDESRDARTVELPSHVTWQSIAAQGEGFAVPIGLDAENNAVLIDLVEAGPHAIIGGTTGSGKSELVRSLALGLAAAAPPVAVQLLCVDFKGGATFAGLTELPHCAGLVTDLDSAGAARVLHSLRAEVRRRERLLAAQGVRDVRDKPEIAPRLFVIVDEFAALIEAHTELVALVADLAARGRSLGVHLVLCTQVPGTTIREAIAANCPVRVSFRVTEPAAASFLGRAAPELVGAVPGRALALGARVGVDHSSAGPANDLRRLQVACITDADIAHVRDLWNDSTRPSPPWLPPLPTVIDRAELECTAEPETFQRDARDARLAFGLVDLPDEQRRALATWQPQRDGPLSVVGAPGSGRSTALAAIAASAATTELEAVVIPRAVPDAWAMLERLRDHADRVLVLADDLDALLARARDNSAALLERWDDATMAVLEAGGAVAASMVPSSAARGQLANRFSSRLLLRTADADEHALLGGPRGAYDRDAPPGRGWWAGRATHVVYEAEPLHTPAGAPPMAWAPSEAADTVVVCRRPDRIADMLRAEHPLLAIATDVRSAATVVPAGGVPLQPRIIVGTPADWNTVWAQLAAVRTRAEIAMIGVPAGEARALLGLRDALPPLDAARGDLWVATPGDPPRRRRWSALVAAASDDRGSGVAT